ncbi:TIGR03668 family PPOX class F420-dependent oxidoreductase [Streptomyces sp. HC44]|uniref:TIGR03668 family PPOX class F420-dependent oxidoreductase n=1 Tax=Streptomyces scabichelini TaxID=2711217 RepID=A0A6G4UZD6_9ACTN|nr:TIGR03668 family PPOX class F420-dependent oxidoreductase [Streptomyces scabichelini]NGO07148.1 TIGR03668 family PPOX class F420-dependent oxidoreductase [Streptomyces scabichelini]
MPTMDETEARRLFAEARVARLATSDAEGRPHLVPLVFAQRGDEIVTAIDWKPKKPGRVKRLANIAVHPEVCLLVDAYDEDWDRLWWVRADGTARVVPPDAGNAPERGARSEYADAVELLRQKYAPYRQQPPDGPVIVISVRRWHGWRARSDQDPVR